MLAGRAILTPPGGLAPGLRGLLAEGITRRGEALTWAKSAGDAGGAPSFFGHLTGWESADSSFHLEDYVPVDVRITDDAPQISEHDQRILLLHGIIRPGVPPAHHQTGPPRSGALHRRSQRNQRDVQVPPDSCRRVMAQPRPRQLPDGQDGPESTSRAHQPFRRGQLPPPGAGSRGGAEERRTPHFSTPCQRPEAARGTGPVHPQATPRRGGYPSRLPTVERGALRGARHLDCPRPAGRCRRPRRHPQSEGRHTLSHEMPMPCRPGSMILAPGRLGSLRSQPGGRRPVPRPRRGLRP